MKRKNNKQLTAMRAYRFTPTLAHIIYARARSLNMNESELRLICKEMSIEIDDSMGEGKIIDTIFGNKCEKNFINPFFIKVKN